MRGLLLVGAFALISMLAAGPASAATSIVLQIASMPGESAVPGFIGAIDVSSVSFGASGPSCAAAISVSSMNISKQADKATTLLTAALRDHTVIPTATLSFVTAGGVVSTKYVMSNVVLESFQQSGSSGGADHASESISFNFSSAVMSYTYIDGTGKAGATTSVTLTSASCP